MRNGMQLIGMSLMSLLFGCRRSSSRLTRCDNFAPFGRFVNEPAAFLMPKSQNDLANFFGQFWAKSTIPQFHLMIKCLGNFLAYKITFQIIIFSPAFSRQLPQEPKKY